MTNLCRICKRKIDARTLRAGGEVCFDCATTASEPEADRCPCDSGHPERCPDVGVENWEKQR